MIPVPKFVIGFKTKLFKFIVDLEVFFYSIPLPEAYRWIELLLLVFRGEMVF